MILYGGLRDTNYRNFFLDELTKIFFMCVEIGLNKNPPSGLVVILDMKGVCLQNIPTVISIFLYYIFLRLDSCI